MSDAEFDPPVKRTITFRGQEEDFPRPRMDFQVEKVSMSPSPKFKDFNCKIVDHEIEKQIASSQRRFNRLRKKIPERSGYTVLFVIEISEMESTRLIRRKYSDFKALHQMLRRKFPRSTMPLSLPPYKTRRYDNAYISGKRQIFDQYLNRVCQVPEIKRSVTLQRFLNDSYLPENELDHTSASSRALLQSFPERNIVVRKGHSYQLNLEVTQSEAVVAWEFQTKKYDVAFFTSFNDISVCQYAREESHLGPIHGFYVCPAPGTFKLTWDNSYAWRRAKRLTYRAEVLDPDVLSATSRLCTFSDAEEAPNVRANRSEATVSECPSYLERMPRPSPRKLAGTIFRRRAGKESFGCLKTGYLMVNRNRRYRTRYWYTKFVVLDVENGVVKYYGREPNSLKRRPQRRLYLTRENASLSIIGSSPTAPTPYCLVVKSGNRHWEICAETASDFESWKEAITSTILLAQFSRGDSSTGSQAIKDEREEEDDDCEEDDCDEESWANPSIISGSVVDDEDSMDDDDELDDKDDDYDELDEKDKAQFRWALQYIPKHHFPGDAALKIPCRRNSTSSKLFWIFCMNLALGYIRFVDIFWIIAFVSMVNVVCLWSIFSYIGRS